MTAIYKRWRKTARRSNTTRPSLLSSNSKSTMPLSTTPEDNNVAIVAAVFLTKAGKHLARCMAKSAERATNTLILRKCVDLTYLRQHKRSDVQLRRKPRYAHSGRPTSRRHNVRQVLDNDSARNVAEDDDSSSEHEFNVGYTPPSTPRRKSHNQR